MEVGGVLHGLVRLVPFRGVRYAVPPVYCRLVASPPKQHPVCDLVTAGVCSPMNTFKVTPQADLGQSRVQEPLIPGPHVSVRIRSHGFPVVLKNLCCRIFRIFWIWNVLQLGFPVWSIFCIFDIDVLVVGGPLIIKPVPMGDVPPSPGTVSGRRAVIVDVREVTPLPLQELCRSDPGSDDHFPISVSETLGKRTLSSPLRSLSFSIFLDLPLAIVESPQGKY